MSEGSRGVFSAGLFSLELQIRTLLEGAGGDDAIELLDSLCRLNRSERSIALKIFKRVIDRFHTSEHRVCSDNDRELNEFEESLYGELIHTMKRASGSPYGRLEVLKGGKTEEVEDDEKTPIDLAAARKDRQSKRNELLN